MENMPVRELIEKLSKFDGDLIVKIVGGEDACGEWAELIVDNNIIMWYN